MTFEELKDIYPEAFLSDKNNESNEFLAFPYYNKWVHLQKEQISKKEAQLLRLLLDQTRFNPTKPSVHSEWQAFLMGERETAPTNEKLVRVIQIELQTKDDDFDKSLWLESISNLFDPVLDAFFLSEQLCAVVQNENGRHLELEEIEGRMQTMDDDFSTKTLCYIGQYWDPTDQYRDIHKEERTIFKREQKRSGKTVLTFPDVALRYYTEEAVAKSPLMQGLKSYVSSQPEWKDLILFLWESRGNVSMAAKAMFIHRNTLQYRIDRFHEATGLSLRDMNDLIICYMLIA